MATKPTPPKETPAPAAEVETPTATQPDPFERWKGQTPVSYDDLIASKVLVQNSNGDQYYLDPQMRSGNFMLRVIPKKA